MSVSLNGVQFFPTARAEREHKQIQKSIEYSANFLTKALATAGVSTNAIHFDKTFDLSYQTLPCTKDIPANRFEEVKAKVIAKLNELQKVSAETTATAEKADEVFEDAVESLTEVVTDLDELDGFGRALLLMPNPFSAFARGLPRPALELVDSESESDTSSICSTGSVDVDEAMAAADAKEKQLTNIQKRVEEIDAKLTEMTKTRIQKLKERFQAYRASEPVQARIAKRQERRAKIKAAINNFFTSANEHLNKAGKAIEGTATQLGNSFEKASDAAVAKAKEKAGQISESYHNHFAGFGPESNYAFHRNQVQAFMDGAENAKESYNANGKRVIRPIKLFLAGRATRKDYTDYANKEGRWADINLPEEITNYKDAVIFADKLEMDKRTQLLQERKEFARLQQNKLDLMHANQFVNHDAVVGEIKRKAKLDQIHSARVEAAKQREVIGEVIAQNKANAELVAENKKARLDSPAYKIEELTDMLAKQGALIEAQARQLEAQKAALLRNVQATQNTFGVVGRQLDSVTHKINAVNTTKADKPFVPSKTLLEELEADRVQTREFEKSVNPEPSFLSRVGSKVASAYSTASNALSNVARSYTKFAENNAFTGTEV